jgi:hypothetical protein
LCAGRLTRIEDFGGKQGSARWRGSLPDLSNPAVLYDTSARAATSAAMNGYGRLARDRPFLERRAMAKVYLWLLPFCFVLYFICYLDRVNIGFAALTMNKDLELSSYIFGLGAGAPPRNLLLSEQPLDEPVQFLLPDKGYMGEPFPGLRDLDANQSERRVSFLMPRKPVLMPRKPVPQSHYEDSQQLIDCVEAARGRTMPASEPG